MSDDDRVHVDDGKHLMFEEHHIDCPRLTNPGLACLCNLIREFGTPPPADIVTRLLSIDNGFTCPCEICEAANEIVRLRAELEWVNKSAEAWRRVHRAALLLRLGGGSAEFLREMIAKAETVDNRESVPVDPATRVYPAGRYQGD